MISFLYYATLIINAAEGQRMNAQRLALFCHAFISEPLIVGKSRIINRRSPRRASPSSNSGLNAHSLNDDTCELTFHAFR